MNLVANFKDSIKQDKLIDMAMAAAVPVYVRYIPSMLKLNGWAGFLVAYIVPILAGMFFKKPAITLAALSMGVGHLVYHYSNDPTKPNDIWDLDPNGTGTIEFNPSTLNGLSGYGDSVNLVNGEPVLQLNGTMADYYEDTTDITTLEDLAMANNFDADDRI